MLSARPVDANRSTHGHAKTPGKSLKNRNALRENAIYHASGTAKGKKLALHTPAPKGSQKAQPLFTISKPPLIDKTPAPNRSIQPSQALTTKLSKLTLADVASDTKADAPVLASGRRRSIRSPKARVPDVGTIDNRFKTPANQQGAHWAVGEESLELGEEVGEELEEAETQQAEDYDEIEYMPPTAIIPPYEPPFELPDYKAVGKGLWNFIHSYPYDDAPPPSMELEPDFFENSGWNSDWDKLDLPEIEDDSPFLSIPSKPRIEAAATTAPQTTTKSSYSRASSTTTTASKRVPVKSSTTSSSQPRTATAALTGHGRTASTSRSTTNPKMSTVMTRSRAATAGASTSHLARAPSVTKTTSSTTTTTTTSTATASKLTAPLKGKVGSSTGAVSSGRPTTASRIRSTISLALKPKPLTTGTRAGPGLATRSALGVATGHTAPVGARPTGRAPSVVTKSTSVKDKPIDDDLVLVIDDDFGSILDEDFRFKI